MRRFVSRAAGLIAAGLCLGLTAHAEISNAVVTEFNTAVAQGTADAILPASRKLGQEALSNPTDPQAAMAAYQAASHICRMGDCSGARKFADFLLGLEGDLPVPRAEAEILAGFVGWSGSRKRASDDKAFQAVLEANTATPASPLTVLAYESFAAELVGTGKWANLGDRAGLARLHMEPVKDVLARRYAIIAILAASSDFNDTQSIDALQEIVDLEGWLYGKRQKEGIEELDEAYYIASAWSYAMTAYFISKKGTNARLAEQISKQADAARDAYAEERTLRLVPLGAAPPEETKAPLCDGRVVSPPSPNYPTSAARKGYVGSVLIGFDFVDGEPANYRVLASVPDGTFEKAALDSMKGFRWEWDKEQKYPGCTKTSRTPVVYPFLFAMG